jgi:hypothetical protein
MSQEWDPRGEVSAALTSAVAGFGAAVLSNADMLRSVLADDVASYPREMSVLTMAAQAGVAASIADLIGQQGVAASSAVSLAAADMSASQGTDPSGAVWAATAVAAALGYPVSAAAPAVNQPAPARPLVPAQYPGANAGRPPARRKQVWTAVAAVAVVGGAIAAFSLHGSGSGGNAAARCVAGTWSLASGKQVYRESNGTVLTFQATSGAQGLEFKSNDQLLVEDNQLTYTAEASGDTITSVTTGQGTASYRVTGSQVQFRNSNVPGTNTIYENGEKNSSANVSLWGNDVDQLTCSGNSMTLSKDDLSYTYTRATSQPSG